MPLLTVTFDYVCPWCWVGWRQARRLRIEFPDLEFRWLGYELLPEGMQYSPAVAAPNAPKKPRIPDRFELLLAAEELTLPLRKRPLCNSRKALEGAEFAWEFHQANAYHNAIYHAYWEEERDIADMSVLEDVVQKIGLDVAAFRTALEARTYRDRIVEFDAPANAKGIWHVPTWMFPEEWVAEQPYKVLRELAARYIGAYHNG